MPEPLMRGSEWRKWDLHVHSPESYLNNQFPHLSATGTPDWDAYVAELERLDVAVLGVTDYFAVDGYRRLREWKSRGRLANVATILPNIELRLNTLVPSRGAGHERRVNLHVLFSDNVSPEDIEDHFLHELHFTYEGHPQGADDRRKVKRSNIEAVGQLLLDRHHEWRERRPLEVGASNIAVASEEVKDILTKERRFAGQYLIVLPSDELSDVAWSGQGHLLRKTLLQTSDLVFSSNAQTHDWCLGLPPYTDNPQAFIEEFRSLKACIHGSDAHELERLCRPCARRGDRSHHCTSDGSDCEMRYCWIKADPTFEGLKQLLYEPADRVRIQATKPVSQAPRTSVERVSIRSTEIANSLKLEDVTLPLNRGLVAIAGPRGSGKTALVDLIANCFTDRMKSVDKNSFVRRIADEDPDITVGVTLDNGVQFSKDVLDGTVCESGAIVYIAQGELEQYLEDFATLHHHILDLVRNSPDVADSVLLNDQQAATAKVSHLVKRIARITATLLEAEAKTAPEIRANLEQMIQGKTRELKEVEEKIAAGAGSLTEEKRRHAETQQAALAEHRTAQQALKEVTERLEVLEEQAASIAALNLTIVEINGAIERLGIAHRLDTLAFNDQHLKDVKAAVAGRLHEINQAVEHEVRALSKLEAGQKDQAKLLDRKQVVIAESELLEKDRQALDREAEEVRRLAGEREQLFANLLESTQHSLSKYEEMITIFATQKGGVLGDITFAASLRVDNAGVLAAAEELLDKRRFAYLSNEDETGLLDSYLKQLNAVATREDGAVPALVREAARLRRDLQPMLKTTRLPRRGDLDALLFGNWLSLASFILYRNTELRRLSLGQKATVLIKIHLAQGSSPIIIDSHDDHLDNEFIMEELVGAIRRAREFRQIFLVSNNGNVVVNCDADQIVVANYQSGTISYIAGALENPIIRERALAVLEGGREAFDQRKKKYRI